MRNSVLICLLFISRVATAQVDSLERKLPSLEGVDKAIAYNGIITFYLRSDLKKAAQFLQEAKQFSKTQSDASSRGYILITQGLYASSVGLTDSATYFIEAAKQLGIRGKNDLIIMKAHTGLGKNFITAGKPEKGLENLYQALGLLAIHPDIETEMKVRVNIMWAYLELKRHKDCIEFGKESIRMADPSLESITLYMYNNIAISYGAVCKLDSARYFIHKGIKASQENSDYQSLANGHFILGTIYSNSGRLDLAINEYLSARPYREKVGNPSFVVSDLYSISALYHKSGKYHKGIEAGLEALKIANQYQLTLKFEGVYKSLAQNYEGLNDFKNSSRYYNLWAIAKDSVYKNATAGAIAEMQTKYESEKKQQQIVVQNAKLSEQKAEIKNTYLVIGALMVITILITIILILAKNRYKRKHELVRKENEVLLREAYIEATIQSQESERKRFAQDLHDSIGQLISSLRLLLSSLDQNSSLEDKVELLAKSEIILDEMHKEIRSVAFNLMPQTLIQLGLFPALQEMALRINQSGKVQITVQCFQMPSRLLERQEISIYRIVQEWTTNTLKYANASRIEIQLVGHENEVTITIEDNGDGFDKSALETGEGNGWKNIQSRLNLIKAEAEIDSTSGRKGNSFILNMPLISAVIELREN